MTTLIFVDKEDGEVGATKNQLRRPSVSSKALSERTQVNTPLLKKAIRTPATSHSVRKALGNVNRTVGVTSKKEQKKDKNQPCSAKKVAEKAVGLASWDGGGDEAYPEIENMFPFDPQDFESFDVTEEDKLSDIKLRGVPLMIFPSTYDKPVDLASSPIKLEKMPWESDLLEPPADFISTLDYVIDMPPMDYDF
ncbi:securin [Coturnix japonica]|uniref:Securin n=1 Tax=Coturnix japonica TaxID=93934 RepID=A0A8C2TAZ5_COTJA|nr:securin [Coturnix japonica]